MSYCTNKTWLFPNPAFGNRKGDPPAQPAGFTVQRQADRRNADLSWNADPLLPATSSIGASTKDHLNLSALMYGQASYEL